VNDRGRQLNYVIPQAYSIAPVQVIQALHLQIHFEMLMRETLLTPSSPRTTDESWDAELIVDLQRRQSNDNATRNTERR